MTADPTRELAAKLVAVRAPHRLAKRFELDASGEPIRVAARWCECGAEMPRGLDAARLAWEQHIAEAQATELLAAVPPADANAPGLREAERLVAKWEAHAVEHEHCKEFIASDAVRNCVNDLRGLLAETEVGVWVTRDMLDQWEEDALTQGESPVLYICRVLDTALDPGLATQPDKAEGACGHVYPDGTRCTLTDHSAPGLAALHGMAEGEA